MDDASYLNCLACDSPLFPATGRAGEDGEHRFSCRCPHCDWCWYEVKPTQCACGAWCIIDIDDEYARVSEVEEPTP